MIRADPESRRDLVDLARDGSVAHRLARRAKGAALFAVCGGHLNFTTEADDIIELQITDQKPIELPITEAAIGHDTWPNPITRRRDPRRQDTDLDVGRQRV